ncbi:acyltransferase [Sphingomonas panacisoli]|uniref:Acyltransferase n=1 Tax=Sphingomonas panacisoli TaxID=1813879 RepID=A0A5B8LKD3_9SPHN|nr:acyltransferase [Sphingomonas panacisoli]QDZ08476.1 acyltransferase [Sphingomonas panacisoli]
MTGAAKTQVLAIDVVRFSCALMVLGFHYTYLFPLAADSVPSLFDPSIAMPIEGARFGWFGWVGVEIFFVVSGYVIALSGAEASSRVFLRRRMLRLAPAAWICSTLSALLLLAGTMTPVGTVALQWLAAASFVHFTKPIDASYWTLSVELMFYILVSTQLRAGGNAPRIERLVMAIGGASVAFWVAAYAVALSPDMALRNTAINATLLPHGVFFALGALLQGMRSGQPRSLARSGSRPVPRGFARRDRVPCRQHARQSPDRPQSDRADPRIRRGDRGDRFGRSATGTARQARTGAVGDARPRDVPALSASPDRRRRPHRGADGDGAVGLGGDRVGGTGRDRASLCGHALVRALGAPVAGARQCAP